MTTPLPGHKITTGYRARGRYWSIGRDANGNGLHTGVDYAANEGVPVLACRGGVVHTRDTTSSYGNRIGVRDAAGLIAYYCHLSAFSVHLGARVLTGQQLGLVGETGNVTGPHLHLEVRRAPFTFTESSFVDPAVVINHQEVAAMASKEEIQVLTDLHTVVVRPGGVIRNAADRINGVVRSRRKPDGTPAAVLDELDGDLLRRQQVEIIERLDRIEKGLSK